MSTSRRPFVALVLAEIFSLSGTRLSMIAIPWLVLTTTGDPMMTGIVAFAEMLPYVIAKALGGPLIDRIGARTISITSDLGSLAAVAMIPVLHLTGTLSILTLMPLVVVMGTLRGPADAAKQAMVPGVANVGQLPLERVTGTMGTVERLATTIGAAAAGALVALIGPALALGVNAATFGASALTVSAGIHHELDNQADEAENSESYLTQFREGWLFLRRDAVLVGIVVMVASTNFLDQAFTTVLMPVWTQQSGNGAELLGLLFATFSAFSVIGSILATGLGEKLPRLPVYTIAFLIAGLPRFMIFAIDAPLVGIFSVLAAAGFTSGFLNPILSAVIFERIPERLIGRVSSLVTALGFALMPFGSLIGGALAAGIGLKPTLIIAGVLYFGATIMPLTLKSFREFSVRPDRSMPV